MTVKELIEKLQKLDGQDLPIKVMVIAESEDDQIDYLFSDTNLTIQQDSDLGGYVGGVIIYGALERALTA